MNKDKKIAEAAEVPVICIAGTHSGCGKTTISLGLMASLVSRGYNVQPFKVGPDFIDPGHHNYITGRDSHNLDGWMLPPSENKVIFSCYAGDADVVVVEGVMGLFDGFSATDDAGSTAQIAKLLGLPVILVVDASSMARSVAALVQGYVQFDSDVQVKGVILNRVGSERHKKVLIRSLEEIGTTVYGTLPKNNDITIPSRHLGLVTGDTFYQDGNGSLLKKLVDFVENNVDLDMLLADTICRLPRLHSSSFILHPSSFATHPSSFATRPSSFPTPPSKIRIAVARDKAFCFYYADNLRLLAEAGAELVFFSPLKDKKLPENIAGLYIGGGYPELYCSVLASNSSLIADIRQFALRGGVIYAECGGFVYLMKGITTLSGEFYPMCGLFDLTARMSKRRVALGYREVITLKKSFLGQAGMVIRGHEFHYSYIEQEEYKKCIKIYRVKDSNKMESDEGFLRDNILGSYIHLHFRSNKSLAHNFVAACREWMGNEGMDEWGKRRDDAGI